MASIRNRAGRWQARVVRKGFPPEAKTFDSRIDAVRWARLVEAEMDRGSWSASAESSDWSLKRMLTRYLAEVTPTKRGAKDEAIRIAAMIRWRLADYSMRHLTPERVAECRDQRLQTVSAGTVIRDLALLSGVINHARREWGLSTNNPCELVRRPPAPEARSRVLALDEQAALMRTLAAGKRLNPLVPIIVTVALETAMRRGELLSMRWEDVDLGARTARLPMTKNGTSRTVPLSTGAINALRSLPFGVTIKVFPMTSMALDRAFSRATRRAGIVDLRFHDLRRTAASRMAAKLPNVIELSAVTGHKTLQMLKRYYQPSASDLARKLG